MTCRLVRIVLFTCALVPGVSTTAFAQATGSIGVSATAAGMRRYEPGQWASIGVQGVNVSDDDGEGMISVYFNEESQSQFARRLWVPAKAMRSSWFPARLPCNIDPTKLSVDMTTMPLIESNGGEVIRRRNNQELLPTTPLLIDHEQVKSVAIFRKGLPDSRGILPEFDNDAYEMMAKARQAADLSRVIIDLMGDSDFVPPQPVMWEVLDHLIVCGDRIVEDSAGLVAVRGWLHRGGRMCVFLDRTKLSTVEAILGHAAGIREVGRVALTEFAIVDRTQESTNARQDRRKFEVPVEFVRVLADGVETQCQVDGWPAAFWQRAGEGEVLFITLSPRGWIPADPTPGFESQPEFTQREYRELTALSSVGQRFFLSKIAEPSTTEVVRPMLEEQIGYRIPSRSLALSLLGGNALALVAGGTWLARRQRLDGLLWLLPILAMVTTAAFVLVGSANNRSIPNTVAFTQLVRAAPDTGDAHISGVAAFYQQSSGALAMHGGGNGIFRPLSEPTEGTARRFTWSDNETGRWLNVSLPGGSVQFTSFDQPKTFDRPIGVLAQFTAAGLTGKLDPAMFPDASDALVAAMPAASSAARINGAGEFVVGVDDVLSTGQYLANTVVSDESRRHQDVYRNLLVMRDGTRFATRPTFFAWTKPLHNDWNWPDDVVRNGAALVAVPMHLNRTAPQTPFTIPATFLRTDVVASARGRSLNFNPRTGQWMKEAGRSTNTRLRFLLPPQVLPATIQSATLTIKLNAPSRELEIYGVVNGEERPVKRIPNPSGVYEIVIDQPDMLLPDADGGVIVGVVVTQSPEEKQQDQDAEAQLKMQTHGTLPQPTPNQPASTDIDAAKMDARPGSFTTWEIEYARATVRGVTK